MTHTRKHGCCVDRDYRSPRGCTKDTCMALPEGKACSDCRHETRCLAIFGNVPGQDYCQFFPRRFALVIVGASDNPAAATSQASQG